MGSAHTDGGAPRKAYYVEVVSRCVSTVLVYADSAPDAKDRFAEQEVGHGDAVYQLRGFGKIRRAPEEDR